MYKDLKTTNDLRSYIDNKKKDSEIESYKDSIKNLIQIIFDFTVGLSFSALLTNVSREQFFCVATITMLVAYFSKYSNNIWFLRVVLGVMVMTMIASPIYFLCK